jgi:hypothetical protein
MEIMSMTNFNENDINKDERALEALLAAAFHLDYPEEISDEQAEKLFQQPTRLSREDKEAIDSWGTDFIEDLVEGQKTVSDRFQQNIEINQELEQEYYAMNRDKDSNDLDEETRRKIDEEHRKALEEENNKNNDSNHGT